MEANQSDATAEPSVTDGHWPFSVFVYSDDEEPIEIDPSNEMLLEGREVAESGGVLALLGIGA